MFDEIISLGNIFAAWRGFRRGKRGKPDVQRFERHLETHLFEMAELLKNRTYQHGPYTRFHVFDPKHRIIHKACVRDRVVHHAVSRILTPFFDRSFIVDSYSCRLEKGTHAAVDRLEQFARKVSRNYTGQCFALKCDIRKFFDSIDHKILMELLGCRISDPNTLWLLQEIIKSYPYQDNLPRERERVKGLPIGNLTSQLFANIYLDRLDHFIKEVLRVPYYIRYTDDFVMFHEDTTVLVGLLPKIRQFLAEKLALQLHPQKIILRKLRQGIDFLGYVVLPHYRVLRTKTKQRMWRNLEQWDRSTFEIVESYRGMLRQCNGHAIDKELREFTNYDECWKYGVMRV